MMRKPLIARRWFLIACMAALLFAAANVFQYRYFTGRIRKDAAVYTEREREAENRYAELAAAFNARPAAEPAEFGRIELAAGFGAAPERGREAVELAAVPAPPVARTGFTGTFMLDENRAASEAREPEIELPQEAELAQEAELPQGTELAAAAEIPQEAEFVPQAEGAAAIQTEADFMPAVNMPFSPKIPPPSVMGGRGKVWAPPVSVGFGVEANNNNRKGAAAGGSAMADYRILSFLAAGARAGFSSNFGYSNTAEGEGFVRLILPVKTPFKRWKLELFAQGGAGISQIFVYGENLSQLLAGGGLGARLLNNGFYIEAFARGGTPFLWGAGLSAGYRFGSEE